MPRWLIPWLFPAAIILLAVGYVVGHVWGVASGAVVALVLAAAGWRAAVMHDEVSLPRWMSGWRPPR